MDNSRIQRHSGCRILVALLASASLATANPLIVVSGSPPTVAAGLYEGFEGTGAPASPN